ncbi:MAG: TonB-dependent receptor [Lacunisphaera sp.]|nr:TonB-dependent receptor [Lacunisphaera sp.]
MKTTRIQLLPPCHTLSGLLEFCRLGLPACALLASVLALAISPSSAVAAEAGTIAGTVINRETRAPLEFALVEIDGLSLQAGAERDGRFTFRGVPVGSHSLRVTYSGFEDAVQAVTVQAGGTTVIEIPLKASEVLVLATLVVEGERSGRAAAVTQQRRSANPVNVITADEFGGTADGRIDDALKRIPGVGFQTGTYSIRGVPDTENSITVDGARLASASGESRNVDTDRIPGDRIERIEVSKSLRPDMEADAVGGTINLVTKSAFDRPRGQFGYNFGMSAIRGLNDDPKPGYAASFAYSDVFSLFGRKNNLGANFSVTKSDKPTLIDLPFEGNEMINIFSNTNLPPEQLVEGTTFPTNVRRRKRAETVERFNFGAKFDYKLGKESTVSFNMFRNESTRESTTKNTRISVAPEGNPTIIPVDAAGNPLNLTAAGVLADFQTLGLTRWRNAQSGLDDTFRINKSVVWLFQGGGRHTFGDYRLDWSVSRSEDEVRNNNADLQVRGRAATHVTIDRSIDPLLPRIIYTGGDAPLAVSLANITTASQAYSINDNTDTILTLRADLTRKFATRFPLELKAGFSRRQQERTNDPVSNTSYSWSIPNAGADFSQFADKPINPFGIYSNELLGVSSQAALADVLAGSNRWTFNAETAARNALSNDGYIKEAVSAGYVMGELRLRPLPLTLSGGLRYERTDVEGHGYLRRGTTSVLPIDQQYTPIQTKGHYGNSFPSFFARYEVSKRLQFRASFSQGIGRPGFSSLRPTTTISDIPTSTGAPGRITQPNPALRPQITNNYDVSAEYFFEPAGLISVSLYRKEISDFMTQVTQILGPDGGPFGAPFAGYELVTRENTGAATVKGLEIAYQQQFVFLPGFLSGLGGYANWTNVDAKGNLPTTGSTTVGALQNYIPDTVNAGLTYQRSPWSIRVLGFWRSGYVLQYNVNPAQSYLRRRILDMDLKLEYKFNNRLRLFLDVYNLLESEPLTSAGNTFRDYTLRPGYIYRRPRQFEAGVKGIW